MTPGQKLRDALAAETPLQIPGAICAYHAILAQKSGFRAIYLSGGGVAAGSLGLPDLGISNLDDVLVDVRRITDVCTLPLLVDVDTGFGASAFNIARTVRSLEKAGAAGTEGSAPPEATTTFSSPMTRADSTPSAARIATSGAPVSPLRNASSIALARAASSLAPTVAARLFAVWATRSASDHRPAATWASSSSGTAAWVSTNPWTSSR